MKVTEPLRGGAGRTLSTKLTRLFEDAHRCGPEEFGMLWIRANEAAVEAATDCHVDPTDLQMKTLLSVAVLKILRKAKPREKGKL